MTDEQLASHDLLISTSWFQKNHPDLYTQRTDLPFVALDFADAANAYPLYTGHEFVFSQVISTGIQQYLQQPPSKTQNVFQP